MDVRSCGSRDHQPRGTRAQADGRIRRNARSPERAQDSRAFFLTDDLHGWRFGVNQLGSEELPARCLFGTERPFPGKKTSERLTANTEVSWNRVEDENSHPVG
jgi:hypothetical protein